MPKSSDDFTTEALAYVLSQHKVLKYDGPAPDEVDEETGAVKAQVRDSCAVLASSLTCSGLENALQ